MSKFGILIREGMEGWEISGLSPKAPKTPKVCVSRLETIELAQCTIAFANQNALDIGQIVIAVASESVLFASLPREVAADIKNNQALRFALESVLPVDAESIVADGIHPFGKGAAGSLATVCLEVSHLKPIVTALEQLDCRIQFIVPSTVLAIEQALSDKSLPAPSISIWMLDQASDVPQVELVVVADDGSVSSWRIFGLDAASLEQNVLQLSADDLPIFLCGTREALIDLASVVPFETRSVESDRAELVRKRARVILSGRDIPCLDLRRDELAMRDPFRRDRKSLNRLAMALCILVATFCGTLGWQAGTFQSLAEKYKQKQLQVFRNAFPGQRTPAAVLGRLKSEHTKAKGIRKTDPKSTSQKSALITLQRIIASLTEEFPFEVREIRIENGRFSMEIALRSQQDAGRIAAALAKEGFDVEPPSTTLVNGDHILASINATIDAAAAAHDNDGGATL